MRWEVFPTAHMMSTASISQNNVLLNTLQLVRTFPAHEVYSKSAPFRRFSCVLSSRTASSFERDFRRTLTSAARIVTRNGHPSSLCQPPLNAAGSLQWKAVYVNCSMGPELLFLETQYIANLQRILDLFVLVSDFWFGKFVLDRLTVRLETNRKFPTGLKAGLKIVKMPTLTTVADGDGQAPTLETLRSC